MPALALPALLGIAAALMALLILYGGAALVRAVGHMIPGDLPIIGAFLRNAVISLGEAGVRVIGHWLANLTSPAAKLIGWPIHVAMILYHRIIATLAALAAATEHVVTATIPRAVSHLRAVVWHHVAAVEHALAVRIHHNWMRLTGAVAAAVALAHHLVHAAVHTLTGEIVQARAYAAHLVHEARLDLRRGIDQAEAAARGLVAGLAAKLADDVDQLARRIDRTLTTAETYTDQAVKTLAGTVASTATKAAEAAVTDIGHDVAATVDASWGVITDEVAALDGVLGADLPDLRALVDAIPKVKATDLAGAVALTEAIALPALRFMRECGVPNCRNLSAFGRDLQALLGFAGDATLIALFAELATDPAGAAADIRATLAPIADATTSAARNLIGV